MADVFASHALNRSSQKPHFSKNVSLIFGLQVEHVNSSSLEGDFGGEISRGGSSSTGDRSFRDSLVSDVGFNT